MPERVRMERETFIYSFAGDGCHARCIHIAHMEDGSITIIKDAAIPDGVNTVCINGT